MYNYLIIRFTMQKKVKLLVKTADAQLFRRACEERNIYCSMGKLYAECDAVEFTVVFPFELTVISAAFYLGVSFNRLQKEKEGAL